MKFIPALLLFLAVATALPAQELPTVSGTRQAKIDSLREQLRRDSAYIFRPKFSKPYLRVENRYSFFSEEPVNLVGFLAGVTLMNRHIICAGYYTFNPFTQKFIDITDDNNVTRREYLILNYFITSYQYVLVNKRFIQINTPFEVGYGLYSSTSTNKLNNHLRRSSGYLVPISAGLQVIGKPVRWMGISCVGGYRHVVQQKHTDLHFKGFYYSFGLWVDARHVIRHTKYYFKKKEYREAVERI